MPTIDLAQAQQRVSDAELFFTAQSALNDLLERLPVDKEELDETQLWHVLHPLQTAIFERTESAVQVLEAAGITPELPGEFY